MNDRIEFVLVEHPGERSLIVAVDLLERDLRAGNFTHAVHRRPFGIRKVVDHDHVVPRRDQLDRRMGSYIPGSAGYQYTLFHWTTI